MRRRGAYLLIPLHPRHTWAARGQPWHLSVLRQQHGAVAHGQDTDASGGRADSRGVEKYERGMAMASPSPTAPAQTAEMRGGD
eukprot:7495284-Pyramimonas_sp.AAC.1